jgi:hypothetical protein
MPLPPAEKGKTTTPFFSTPTTPNMPVSISNQNKIWSRKGSILDYHPLDSRNIRGERYLGLPSLLSNICRSDTKINKQYQESPLFKSCDKLLSTNINMGNIDCPRVLERNKIR